MGNFWNLHGEGCRNLEANDNGPTGQCRGFSLASTAPAARRVILAGIIISGAPDAIWPALPNVRLW